MGAATTTQQDTAPAGAFVRVPSSFREWVSRDGSTEYPAEAGRYHLYVSLACPWAHRTVIARALKRLDDVVTMTVVDPLRDELGWAFRDVPGAELDPVNGFRYLGEAYFRTDPRYRGRVSVPVLWDRQTRSVVNNESADIIVMLNDAFAGLGGDDALDLYPAALRDEMDALDERIYETVNDGVYRAGFSRSQAAYEDAFDALFATLDVLDERLRTRRYLHGPQLTLSDLRLFTTLIRFDGVYYLHFKCNLRRIVDYPSLWGYLRDVYAVPGIAETVSFDHIKRHYYLTHGMLNPRHIVPKGPALDLTAPHGRERL
jgi:putative glutathione S-transferase